MGYYSDVALCLSKAGAEKLAAAIEARIGNTPDDFGSNVIKALIGGEPVRKDEDTGTVAFCWSGVKWYSDFEGVAFVENFMADLDDEDYYFIRIGEDYDDIEVIGGFWDNPLGIQVMREITCC